MKKENPLISIIIPTRNRYEFIRLLIGDLRQQDFTDFEIIVVDQSDKVEKLEGCHQIVSNTLGPCVSRNLGVKNAKGNILVFLDDDGRVYGDFVREITTSIINNEYSIVIGAVCSPKGDYLRSEGSYLKAKNENFIKVLTSSPYASMSRICMAFSAGCGAIKKEIFNEIGGFDESFDPTGAGEDRDMALKLFLAGHVTWYNAKAKLLHAVASKGGSRGLGSRSLMLDIHTFKMAKKYFSDVLAHELKCTILRKYKKNFLGAIKKGRGIRTQYRALKKIRTYLKEV